MRKDAITLLCFFVFSVQTCYGNDRANDPWFLKCASDYALEGWRGRTDAKYYKRVDKLDLTQIPIPFLEKTHFTIETVKNDNIESLYFLKCEKIELRVDIHFLENIYLFGCTES